MDENHSLLAVRRCMETGEVLRPVDYPRGYYFHRPMSQTSPSFVSATLVVAEPRQLG